MGGGLDIKDRQDMDFGRRMVSVFFFVTSADNTRLDSARQKDTHVCC